MGTYRRKLKDGWKWRYVGSYRGLKYQSPAVYDTKEAAELAEKAHRLELEAGVGNTKLFHLTKERLLDLQVDKSLDYCRDTERYLEIAKQAWGDVPVQTITKGMVRNLVTRESKRLQKAGKQNYAANALLRALKSLFQYCIDYHDVDMRNPCKGVLQLQIDKAPKHIPTDYEIWYIKEYHLDQGQRELVSFCEESGCRVGEALSFEVKDINDKLVYLYTRKSRYSDRTYRPIPKPRCLESMKLPKSGRVFKRWSADGRPRFLDRAVRRAMEDKPRLLYSYPADDDQFNAPFLRESEERGGVEIKDGMKYIWRGYDGKPWSYHNLRHRAASRWMHSGMNVLEISMRLGHTSITTTENYLQLLGFTEFTDEEKIRQMWAERADSWFDITR